MKILIASQNPVKINASLKGFQRMFPNEKFEAEGASLPSGVSDQPQNDSETLSGAWNRVQNAYAKYPDADFYVGIEGGIEEKNNEIEVFAWVVVQAKDGQCGKARAGTFFLPPQLAKLIKEGKELGEADDIIFGRKNSKQENGTVGVLTNNVIDRTQYYTEAIVLALIPLKNRNLYGQ